MKHRNTSSLLAAVVLAVVTALSSPALADVTVTLDPGEGGELAQELGLDLSSLEAAVKTEIAQVFAVADPGEYLRALNDAQAFTSKGLGVDYASDFDYFVIGAAASIGLSLGDETLDEANTDRPIGGLAPNISAMAGLRLGFMGLDNWRLFLNGFQRSATLDDMSATLRTAGAHLQYNLFATEITEGLPLQWTGILLTTGWEYSYLELDLEGALTSKLPVSGSVDGIDVMMDSTGILHLDTTAMSVPFEASTAVRILYFVSLYGGIGFDMQFGGGATDIALEGDLYTNNPADGSRVDLGTASVAVSEETGPSVGKVRFFAGAQLNLFFLNAFVQANLAPNAAAGLTFGGRFAF